MEARCYVDISFERQASPLAAALVLRALHGVFRHSPGRYALALPDYPRGFTRLRVFAETRDDLDRLVTATDGHPGLAEHGRFGYPKNVAADFAGPWISYRRYRIPSRKAERKPEGSLRLRRIQAADEADLPYFPLRSESTGQTWRLYVEACEVPHVGTVEPDSYGLALSSRPFGLPALP